MDKDTQLQQASHELYAAIQYICPSDRAGGGNRLADAIDTLVELKIAIALELIADKLQARHRGAPDAPAPRTNQYSTKIRGGGA